MVTLATFYKSKEWEEFRRNYLLMRGDLICEKCGKPLLHKYEAILHHINELTENNVNDASVTLNPDNIMLLCHHCHNEIHNKLGVYVRHVYVVFGSPCSGKTTFVEKSAGRNDLIVDVDKLYAAVTVNALHDKPGRLLTNVLGLRSALIDQIKTRYGKWNNAWIIISKCRPMELKRMSDSIGAELIHIREDKELCLARAQERPDIYEELINNYYADYALYRDLIDDLAPPA